MKPLTLLLGIILMAHPVWADDLDFLLKNTTQYDNVLVEEVRAPNLIVIRNKDMKKETVRLIGLKVAEIRRKDRPKVEHDEFGFRIEPEVNPEAPVEEKAFAFAIHLMDHKRVRLEFDNTKTDDDFNTLAYVYLRDSGLFANAEILRQGYAQLQIRPPNTKHEDELLAAYKEARKELRGYHGQ